MTNETRQHNATSITTPSDTEIRIERVFDASRDVVWRAYTEPELVAQWLGPHGYEMSVEEMEVQPGGSYRYTHRDPEGNEYKFFGEFREVVAPELLVSTFNFEGAPGTSVDRAEFSELEGGRTQLVAVATFESKEQRDGMLQAGMERGVVAGYEKLDALLA